MNDLKKFFGGWNVYFDDVTYDDSGGGGDGGGGGGGDTGNTDPGYVTPEAPQDQPATGDEQQQQDQAAQDQQAQDQSQQDQSQQWSPYGQGGAETAQPGGGWGGTDVTLSPSGTQAPPDQTNIDLGTGQTYPPGLIAPQGGTQVNLSGDITAALGPLQGQINNLTAGLKSYNPALAAQMASNANAAAQREFQRWQTQLQYSNIPAADRERIALQQAQLAADTAVRQAQVALEQRRLELQYTQMTPFEKEQMATQRAIADLQSQTQKQLQGTQITSTEKMAQWNLAQQERQSGRTTALNLLQQIGQLRGPQNAFALLRTLQAIPGGLQGVVRALAGEFNLPTMGGVTQGTPATIGGQIGDILNNGSGILSPEEQQAAGTFVNPNQVPIQNWNALPDYAKQVALAQWESQGLDPGMIQQMIKSNAPNFQTPTVGKVNAFG